MKATKHYVAADHQWLEEHLHFNDEFEHTGGMDLYMPIAPKERVKHFMPVKRVGEGNVKSKVEVTYVYNSDKMSIDESISF